MAAPDLLCGAAVITASAGTGKTYCLERLYVRMLLGLGTADSGAPGPERILAVTFTEKAALEMKERIRSLIYSYLEEPEKLHELFPRITPGQKKQYLQHLESTRHKFDQAAIYTIHGFCRRLLAEYPAESGTQGAYETGDTSELLSRAVHETLRLYFTSSPPASKDICIINWLREHFYIKSFNEPANIMNIEKVFCRVIASSLPHEETYDFFPSCALFNNTSAESLLKKTAEKISILHHLLEQTGAENIRAYLADSGVNPVKDLCGIIEKFKNDFSPENLKNLQPDALPKIQNNLYYLLAGRSNDSSGFTDGVKILAGLFSGRAASFFRAVYNALLSIYEYRVLEIFFAENVNIPAELAVIFSGINSRFTRLKQEKKITGFDDLLLQVYRAFSAADSRLLALVQEKYCAVLIDEFQDTDAVQWKIFRLLCGHRKNFPLFLIGDPKQSIYHFRGGNLPTFFSALETVPDTRHYELKDNYRSHPDLVAKFNILFKNIFCVWNTCHTAPLPETIMPQGGKFLGLLKNNLEKSTLHNLLSAYRGTEKIPADFYYQQVNAGKNSRWAGFTENAGKIILYDLSGSGSETLSAEKVRRHSRKYVAAEIFRLLSSGLKKNNGEKLCPGDIAVLCDKNEQCRQTVKDLCDLGLKAVFTRQGSVWKTDEAFEIKLFFEGLVKFRHPGCLKGALTSSLLGINEQTVCELEEQGLLDRWGAQFEKWENMITEKKVYKVILEALYKTCDPEIPHDFFRRSLSASRGSRTCANMLHLAELLHEAVYRENLDSQEILAFINKKISAENGVFSEEESEVRLDSDLEAVEVLTLHAAKGLEWPVVFIMSSDAPKSPAVLDSFYYENKRLFTLSGRIAGSSRKNREIPVSSELGSILKKFSREEKFRLFYVGFTRAQSLLYIPFIPQGARSTCYLHDFYRELLGYGDDDALNHPGPLLDRYKDVFQTVACTAELPEPEDDKKKSQAGTAFRAAEPPPEKLRLKCLPVESYSSLSRGLIFSKTDGKAGDESGENQPQHPAVNRFNFAAGPQTGNLFHSLFEKIDYSLLCGHNPDSFMADSGIDRKFQAAAKLQYSALKYQAYASLIKDIFFETLKVPLGSDEKKFTLADIPSCRRRHEFQFLLPLAESALCLDIKDRSRKLLKTPEGYLYGIIDLVFMHNDKYYIADWKSNCLGDDSGSYHEQNIIAAMQEHDYFLQYYLYTLGLYVFLSASLPGFDYDRDFGGVYYFFIRGMSKEYPGRGVFFDRPAKNMIEELCSALLRKKPGN